MDSDSSADRYCAELQGLTIVVTGTLTVTLSLPDGRNRAHEQPAALGRMLRMLRAMRFRAQSDAAHVVVRVQHMRFRNAAMQELRGLPQLDIPCSLDLQSLAREPSAHYRDMHRL